MQTAKASMFKKKSKKKAKTDNFRECEDNNYTHTHKLKVPGKSKGEAHQGTHILQHTGKDKNTGKAILTNHK